MLAASLGAGAGPLCSSVGTSSATWLAWVLTSVTGDRLCQQVPIVKQRQGEDEALCPKGSLPVHLGEAVAESVELLSYKVASFSEAGHLTHS